MDYARLRDEGLRLLGRLAGAQWTDFNTHDPGITILEQLCYAITDLGYRIAYPMPELLAGGDPGLPGPEAIFPTDPVTAADLRKAALDVHGIGNAWVEDAGSQLPFYHDAASDEIRLRAGSFDTGAGPVQMRGLHRVVVQATEQISSEAARTQVTLRLHARRGLGSDFVVSLVGTTPVDLRATLEIGAADDPAQLAAEVIDQIESYLAPKVRSLTWAEARAQGRPLEEILEGPLLDRRFIEQLPAQRRTVYVSDLLHAILDVPGVRAVRSLVLQGSSTGPRWALDIPPGTVATLAPTAELTLLRDDLPLRVAPEDVRRHLDALHAARAISAATDDSGQPSPRPRDLMRSRSIQYQLPAAYGVGPLGLPASAPPERRAQARQLAAYLLIFDQLFASALAQLAHAGELLSPADGPPRTYFALPVEDARLATGELRIQDPAGHRAWLDAAIETGDPLERRKRFLAHLLARFAEELGDHARSQSGGSPDELLVADRRALLRNYPRLSRARGSGYDISRHGQPDAVPGGYEDRLRHKLGLGDPARLHVVEHVLLRPVVEDLAQLADEGDPQVPLLAGVTRPDPWSLCISVVLAEPAQPDEGFEQFVAQTLAAETPAHLSVCLHWLGGADGSDDWAAFESAWDDFRAAHLAYRATLHRGEVMPRDLQLRLRDARDRVIDALSYVDPSGQRVGLGRTYPLRDLPLPEQIVVAPGMRATIVIGFSQPGVTYELRDRDTGQRVLDAGAAITVDGTGGPIELVTPPIDVDTSYRLLAIKREGAQTPELRREAWLRSTVRVVEGVDASLVANILLPLLDPRIDTPRPHDARLGDWGVEAEVEIPASQEGVTYVLVEDAADLSDVTRHRVISAQEVIGTSGRIVLRTVPIQEDIDLRIRGQKVTGTPENPVTRTAILDLVLPLRVRANPAASAQLVPPVVAYGGTAVLRLGATQASAEYHEYRSRVRDTDFVFGTGAQVPTIDVPGDDQTVRIQRPPKPTTWQDLAGFAPVGVATRGNGGALDLAIGAPGTDDAFLLVQASKRHQTGRLGTGSEELPSAVQLDTALALLVRPDPAPALRLEVTMAASATTGSLMASGGQSGVFYEIHLDDQTQPIARPAYFHQRDDQSDQLNKGIGQLRIGVDGVVARDRPPPAGDPVTTPPAAPLLETAPLPAGSTLRVLARKAMSGLEAPLDHLAVLAGMPAATAPTPIARGESTEIVIEASRQGERYWLLRDGQPAGDVQVGTGGRIALPTGAIAERTVFAVAAMLPDDQAIAVERHVEIVIDAVEGVDSSVVANILLPLLDPRIDNPGPHDARLGDWGVEAEVEIPASQEGVTYVLIEDAADLSDVTTHRVISAQEVIGTSGRIVLRTLPIQEDIDLRIRGQKFLGPSASPPTRTAILDLVLPLRVRANPAATAQLVPPVVAYGGAAVLRLGATQASAEYHEYRGRVRDADFVFDTGAQLPTIDVPGDGRTVRIQRPPKPPAWEDLAGFAPIGDATRGNGGALDLAIGAPGTDDAFLVVQASKRHQTGRLGTGSEELPSAVQLDTALALLVRPNPAQALRLEVTMAAGATTGSLLATSGQLGVFYELRLDGQTQAIGLPAYFHPRDDQSDQLNKGIDQVRLEVDDVVARDRPEPAGDPATTPPAAPLLATAPLPAGSTLHVLARKAMSGLEAPLDRLAVLDDLPAVTAPAPVVSGASADIVIEASRSGERYGLLSGGQPVGDVQIGTGGRIALPTGAVTERTMFTLAATRPDDQALAVERHVEIVVEVIAETADEVVDGGAGEAIDPG